MTLEVLPIWNDRIPSFKKQGCYPYPPVFKADAPASHHADAEPLDTLQGKGVQSK